MPQTDRSQSSNTKDLKKVRINLKSKLKQSSHFSNDSSNFMNFYSVKFCLFCENPINSNSMQGHAESCTETINFIEVYNNRPSLSVLIEGIKRKISELGSWLLTESSNFSQQALKLTLGIQKYIRNEEDDFEDPLSPIHIYRKDFS